MTKLIHWLSSNKIITSIIILVYYALVILPHEWVGLKINAIFSSMPRSRYDLIILVTSLLGIVGIGLLIGKKLWSHARRSRLLLSFGLTLFLIFLVNSFLFVINIESVHYVQYAVGAILLFTLIGHYYVTIFAAFLISLVDEGYQYFYLAPERTNYFDINDIITDFLGTCLGLLILKTFSIKEWGNPSSKLKKGFFIPLGILTIGFLIALKSSLLSIFPSEDKFMLVRVMEEGFWTTLPPNVSFHVVGPLEGLIMMVGLFVVYFFVFGREEVLGA